ncbi:MAG: hypothetical protein AAGE80_04860 [Pseudomonadota bacterium]
MKRLLIAALCVVATACGSDNRQAAPQPEVLPTYASLRNSDCYTVDLFDPVKYSPPGPEVPAQYQAFYGAWVGGAWNGKWCHDLIVYEIKPNGEVKVLSMHAPNSSIDHPPTVFKRRAVIDINNTLRFTNGANRHVYQLDRHFLVGKRTGPAGDYTIALTRENDSPLPVARPVTQIAQNN